MKFNTIILCIILWCSVEFIAIVVSILHRITLKQEHIAKKKYMQRLLELASQEQESGDIIRELYYSFIKDRKLRIVLLQSMRYSTEKSFMYIYSKIGCEPMKKIHTHLMKRMESNEPGGGKTFIAPIISISTRDYLLNDVEIWDQNWKDQLKKLKKRRNQAFIEMLLSFMINLYIYFRIQSVLCLMICVVVNTIGVIMYIIIDYECSVEDSRTGLGNDIFEKYEKKISQTFARGIENIYQLAASLGLIINITTVVMQWLGPVA
ncbi:hypothetical protein SAMN02910384_01259 [Pseudobutyrivibrio sp. ACV-2]|uniref:hypothetical protein n=1 Tax=Pseudobutyrivibrio sp. ACV-2 TaxID=1520801 RepID=UPI000897CE3E|nr:hypothetical protein [Pseudobutyrivibrio sp. ACV-2]SEA30610.1 hypothetical protein SAMN02910384_01259 [Pseudobutyrivibrio sp. ACV-2]